MTFQFQFHLFFFTAYLLIMTIKLIFTHIIWRYHIWSGHSTYLWWHFFEKIIFDAISLPIIEASLTEGVKVPKPHRYVMQILKRINMIKAIQTTTEPCERHLRYVVIMCSQRTYNDLRRFMGLQSQPRDNARHVVTLHTVQNDATLMIAERN